MNKKIKIFLTDIDGVWTDGGMYYDQSGNELKKFNTSDSAGVKLLNYLGIPTVIITGENTEIVRRRSEKLNISYLYQGVKNKLSLAQKISNELKISLSEMAYIGDDYMDLNLLKEVGLSACPINAIEIVKNNVDWIINMKGGDGVFRAFVEKYLKSINKIDDCYNYLIQENCNENI